MNRTLSDTSLVFTQRKPFDFLAERDACFTEDQIRALSADYTIGLNDAGNVQMKFNLFESADLNTFAPLTVNPDSVSVVDGSICLEFAPEDRAAFFRFSVEQTARALHPVSCFLQHGQGSLHPVTGYRIPESGLISGQLLALTVVTKAKRLRDRSLSR